MKSYKLREVRPNIYLLSFDNRYDLAMTFLRYSEFYENPTWKGKYFSISEFMEWYAKSDQASEKFSFTYPNDWAGWNLSGRTLNEFSWASIPDWNDFDTVMRVVSNELQQKCGDNYYLIGAQTEEDSTIRHEIAHGLFECNPFYRAGMDALLKELDAYTYESLKEWLTSNMYHESVVDDEIQAYLSTGLTPDLKKWCRKQRLSLRKELKTFKDYFEIFYNHGQHNETLPERSRKAA